ncbi:putative C6 finger domain protein [Sarocladium strictum]
MVYCGKPSKGCSVCRERKVRCDQKEPSCGQCQKRGHPCPGYRNLVDLMFRDESNHVIKKATNTRSRAVKNNSQALQKPTKSFPRAKLQPNSSATDADPAAHGPEHDSPSSVHLTDDGEESRKLFRTLTYSLTPSLCERGTAFFFSRYVAVETTCHQGFDFIYEIWKPPTHHSAYFASSMDCVTASMVAVGLAGLSKLTGNKEAGVQAQHSYGIALTLTNTALRDPVKCSADSTMLAVLILGTYEFLAGRSPQTMDAWQNHVTGAAALANLRGTAQFSTNSGTRMFLMLCHSVLVNCIQAGIPMPKAMVDLRLELVRQSESQRASWRLAEPVYLALQTRYDIKQGLIADLDEILDKLQEIDDNFASLLSALPESWAYRTVELTQDNPVVLGRHCHIYAGLQQVTLWNGVRTVRMLLLQTMLEQLYSYAATFPSMDSIPVRYRELTPKTMATLEALGTAIIASVPQHFGVVSARSMCPARSRLGASPLPADRDTIRSVLSRSHTRSASPTSAGKQIHMPSLAASGATLLDPIKPASKEGTAERFMTLASASNTILWPLYVLGMSSSCSLEKREYVMDRIDAIYRETKLEQAQTVCRLLETRTESCAEQSLAWDQLLSLPRCVPSAAV